MKDYSAAPRPAGQGRFTPLFSLAALGCRTSLIDVEASNSASINQSVQFQDLALGKIGGP